MNSFSMQPYVQDTRNVRPRFLPDLKSIEIKELQSSTAQALNLQIYFSDALSVGGLGPELAIIPAGQYEMG